MAIECMKSALLNQARTMRDDGVPRRFIVEFLMSEGASFDGAERYMKRLDAERARKLTERVGVDPRLATTPSIGFSRFSRFRAWLQRLGRDIGPSIRDITLRLAAMHRLRR